MTQVVCCPGNIYPELLTVLRDFDVINTGLTFFFPTQLQKESSDLGVPMKWKASPPPLPITRGLLCSTSVSSHSKSLFLLSFPWPSSDLFIRLTVLQQSVTNRFAHYVIKRDTCKSEEGKNSTDGLISAQTGRKDRFICKNTVCLALNSLKNFYSGLLSFFSMVSMVKIHFFFRGNCKKYFDSTPILQ